MCRYGNAFNDNYLPSIIDEEKTLPGAHGNANFSPECTAKI